MSNIRHDGHVFVGELNNGYMVLLNFLATVKAAPHECSTLDMGKS